MITPRTPAAGPLFPLTVTACVLLGLAAGGCRKDDRRPDKADDFGPIGYFAPEAHTRPVSRWVQAQIDAGTTHDAMLRPSHFGGDALNSLGREKVARLVSRTVEENVEENVGGVVTIYLNVEGDTAAKREAVADFLDELSIPTDAYAFADGPNPDRLSPAAEGLARQGRTEHAPVAGGSGVSTSSTAPQGSGTLFGM